MTVFIANMNIRISVKNNIIKVNVRMKKLRDKCSNVIVGIIIALLEMLMIIFVVLCRTNVNEHEELEIISEVSHHYV